MGSVDFRALAPDIARHIGGGENVSAMTHCATRLRLKLRDNAKADKAAIEKLPGVITVMQAGGQYQIVIGNNVPIVYEELTRLIDVDAAPSADEKPEKTNPFNAFIQLISSIFSPILWPLAGTGLLKALIAAAGTFGWLDTTSTTYTILNASADSLFYFLPMFLAITAAKRFKADQFTALAIAGALVYPSIVALNGSTDPVSFFGLPVTMMSYTSSVIPIIVAVWLQSYLQRGLHKILPHWLRNFTTPLLSVVIMVPLVLLTVGPVTMLFAGGVSDVINYLFAVAPAVAGAILGGLWQVFVLFGLHWGLIPVMINDLGNQGFSLLFGPLPAAVLAQSAAAIAVALRTRSEKRREVAAPAALSGILAGITEPIIYGVNLPLKKPFYFGLAGGAVGGAIAAAGGSAAGQFVFPSLLGLVSFTEHGNFALQLIGTGVAVVIGFSLTFLFCPREQSDDQAAAAPEAVAVPDAPEDEAAPVSVSHLTVKAPVSGTAVALTEVSDKVFASEVMGKGVAVVPDNGRFVSPVAGTVVVAMPSGHAFGLKTPEGVEVLVHIGIDTVQMEGDGFTPHVSAGDSVQAGDPICDVDLGKIGAAGYDTTTVVVITNTGDFADVAPVKLGHIRAGADAVAITR